MPTKFMKLGFDDKVIRRVANVSQGEVAIGYTVDVGLNYYRGTPISAVERLELHIDGQRVPDDAILVEINSTYLRTHELPLAFTEYWGVKTPLRLHVTAEPLSPGEHDVEFICEARVVYMQFAPGVFGKFDASARATVNVEE